MLDKAHVERYLAEIEVALIKQDRKHLKLNRAWINSEFPAEAGIYIFFEGAKLVYVGESGNIRKRVTDLLDTRNHTLRRSIGEAHFSKEPGYEKASSKKSFNEQIERKVEDYIEKKLAIGCLAVPLGRKELEERLYEKYQTNLYNKRGKRTGK